MFTELLWQHYWLSIWECGYFNISGCGRCRGRGGCGHCKEHKHWHQCQLFKIAIYRLHTKNMHARTLFWQFKSDYYRLNLIIICKHWNKKNIEIFLIHWSIRYMTNYEQKIFTKDYDIYNYYIQCIVLQILGVICAVILCQNRTEYWDWDWDFRSLTSFRRNSFRWYVSICCVEAIRISYVGPLQKLVYCLFMFLY